MNQEIVHIDDKQMAGSMPADLSVVFSNCVEGVGIGLVATEGARALVPAPFRLAGEGEVVTPLVVLGVRGEITFAGQLPTAGIFVQIGLVIAPPDATGDVNVYTCWYYTSHAGLARSLRRFGINAQRVPEIDFHYLPSSARAPLRVIVAQPGEPPLSLEGSVLQPGEPVSFVANWWAKSESGSIKMTTSIPRSLVAEASLTLTTDPRSALGQLIGAASTDFSVLQRFNTFAHARLNVGLLAPEPREEHSLES
jgi:hypothetical protein